MIRIALDLADRMIPNAREKTAADAAVGAIGLFPALHAVGFVFVHGLYFTGVRIRSLLLRDPRPEETGGRAAFDSSIKPTSACGW